MAARLTEAWNSRHIWLLQGQNSLGPRAASAAVYRSITDSSDECSKVFLAGDTWSATEFLGRSGREKLGKICTVGSSIGSNPESKRAISTGDG